MSLVTDDIATNNSTVFATTHAVQFSPVAQLPVKLQGTLNFLTWKTQLEMLLNGINSWDILMQPKMLHCLLLPNSNLLF